MGLFGMMARTAVVAGTATAVSNRVSRRQATKWQQQDQQPPPQYQQAPPAPAPEPAADSSSLAGELQKLASLKEQGILSEDEFTAAKNKLLGI